MSQHIEIDKTVQMMASNAEELLKGHGFEIVTEDKQLFPYFTPGLAALKSGRLLVFYLGVFPRRDYFDQEVMNVQNYFQNAVDQNTPDSDPRVQYLERIAVILAPVPIQDKVPAGEIHWIGVGNLEEMADKTRRELAL